MNPHFEFTDLILALPGMVRVRRDAESADEPRDRDEIVARFNRYDFVKTLIGWIIAGTTAFGGAYIALSRQVDTLTVAIQKQQDIYDERFAQVSLQLTTMAAQQSAFMASLVNLQTEQARRTDAVEWARKQMQNGGSNATRRNE